MEFNSGYASPMDRGYKITIPVNDMPSEPPESPITDEVGYGVKDVGMSVPLGISAGNVQGVQAKIRAGVGSIELGFPGAVSGNRQAQTPGMYGKEQRQALREISKVNEVKFTTHAAYNLMGLTGVDQQGNFSWTHRKIAVDEVKRAIDFASDTAGGGSVVVHTGEFERPISEQPWARDENGRLVFRKYIHEPFDAQYKVLDNRTGQIMSTVQKDRLVARSKWLRSNEDREGLYQGGDFDTRCNRRTMIKKGDYIDYEGNKVVDPYSTRHGRVPVYDKKSGRFEVEMWHFDDFVKEAEVRNREMEGKLGRKLSPREMLLPEELYLQATLETQEGHSRGWALQYGERVDTHLEQLKKLKEIKRFYEGVDKNLPEDEKYKLMRTYHDRMSQIIPPETKHVDKWIDKEISEIKKSIEFEREASSSQEQQAADTAETRKHIISQVKRMYDAAYRSYAEAGLHSMKRSKDKDNPVFVAMENIFPDRYGGHPDELKDLIRGSRGQMVELLTQPYRTDRQWDTDKKQYKIVKVRNEFFNQNIKPDEAKKLAQSHIKATIDTGHFNMWRKYYMDNPDKSIEDNDKDFKNWMVDKVEDLAKDKMIGNVHLTDNFGYQDDHLAPGQGNAPVKEVLKVLKKHGYDKALTVEPGADASTDQSDVHGVLKTWRHLGAPIYSMGGAAGGGRQAAAPNRSWGDVQHSYFGQTYPPYFIFGAYSPSNDWTLWSQVPME